MEKPEAISDIQREASALIWVLSKLPYIDLESLFRDKVKQPPYDITKVCDQTYHFHVLFKTIEWLSGIACDDWWCSRGYGLDQIVEEIENSYTIPITKYFGKSHLDHWINFCNMVCDAAKKERRYGQTALPIKQTVLTYERFKQIGEQNGLVKSQRKPLSVNQVCLVPVQ